MAKFVDAVIFVPTAGGTTDFTVSAAVNGYMTPAQANATSGAVYRYRAESATLTQWEIGYGVYNAGVLARTVVLYNSLGTTAKINFSSAPNVGMGMPIATDIFPTASDTPPTDPADNALWWESDTGILYLYYNDGTSKQWVGISTNAALAAVLYTAQSLSNDQKAQARANIDVMKKNYIINGAMMISQENGTAAGTASNYYPVDQFRTVLSGSSGVCSFAQVLSNTPAGSPNRLRATVTTADAAVASTDVITLMTKLEGLRVAELMMGTASAKTITIRFGVKAPAGTYSLTLQSASLARSYVAEYVISGGEANTDVVKTVTIALDQAGSWVRDASDSGVNIIWGLMVGSSFAKAANAWGTDGSAIYGSTNQFNFMGTISNVFELFDVGMYEGSIAPAFQVPDFAAELYLCQRYFEVTAKVVGPIASGFFYGTTLALANFMYKVEKRIAPTISYAGATSDYSVYRAGANNAIDTAPTVDGTPTTTNAILRFAHSTAPFTAGQSCVLMGFTNNAQLRINARV